VQGGGKTIIGNDNWIMACVHIAHDCVLGDHIIMANNTSLAGHVTVGNWAILSGYSLIHQFCTVGEHSFTSFASHVNQSVPPYVTVSGEKAKARGVNTERAPKKGTLRSNSAGPRAYKVCTGLEDIEEARKSWRNGGRSEIQPLVDFWIAPKSMIR
jgi:UDP-N-acetylglucosamine acyltransferase